MLVKMGGINARNMLSWLELLINRYCCIYLVVYIVYMNDARSIKNQIYTVGQNPVVLKLKYQTYIILHYNLKRDKYT